MLRAEQLVEAAYKAADRADTCTAGDRFVEAEMALITCAIYTVGAELIGRLDNLHFEADSYAYQEGHMERISCTEGHIRPPYLHLKGSKNDNSSKSEDSSAGQEELRTGGDTKGE